MNILMLGNSFTYCNDMPGMLAEELNASVTEVVRGGAYLHGFLDQEDELRRPQYVQDFRRKTVRTVGLCGHSGTELQRRGQSR